MCTLRTRPRKRRALRASSLTHPPTLPPPPPPSDGTVKRLGRPTMDGEEEERHTSFRVPKGVKVE